MDGGNHSDCSFIHPFEGEQTMVCDTNDFPFGQLRLTLDYFRKPLMVQLNFATCPKPKSLKVSGGQDCCRSRHNKGGAPCSEDPRLTSLQQRR